MQTDAHPPLPLPRAQERALRTQACRHGDWTRLAFFYWSRGDHEALFTLRESLGAADGNLRSIFQLALPHIGDESLPISLSSVNKPWILYYLAEQALHQGNSVYALHCAMRCLELTPHCNPLFMLLIRHNAQHGDKKLAHSLGTRLLSLSADQDDVRIALEGPLPPREPLPQGAPAPLTIGYYVPVYNAASSIVPVLKGILAQAYPLSDLVIVDDGSTDASATLAQAYPVRLLSHGSNKGLATARNTALEAMNTDYVGSCDSDAVLDPDYLIYAALEWTSSLAPLAAIGGRMMEQHTGSLADFWRDTHMSQDTGHLRKCSWTRSPAPIYLPGCNTLLHRETVLSLGGYDTRHVAVGEDGYMNRLLHSQGYGIATTPLARCRHLRRDTPASALRTRWNYEWEGMNHNQTFATMHRLNHLLRETLAMAQRMAKQDIQNYHFHLLAMEVLYVCQLYLLSLRHGWERSALTLGHWHWYEQAFLNGAFPDATLRCWCLETVSPLLLPPDSPYDTPPAYLRDLNQQALREVNQWITSLLPKLTVPGLSATR